MRRCRDQARVVPLLAVVLAVCCACTSPTRSSAGTAVPTPSLREGSPPPVRAVPAVAPRRALLGHSVLGRPLVAWQLGPADAPARLLVVGCIHGDESAGIAPAEALLAQPPPSGVEVVVVPNLNPDGVAAHRRQNADGVDLNRNFPYRWTPSGRRGDQQYPGVRALSEPESRAAATLIGALKPTVSVWFHQPLDLVDLSGGAAAVEWRFARQAHLAVRQLVRYPGSVTGWQNVRQPGTTAFVVELPRVLRPALRSRLTAALRDLERANDAGQARRGGLAPQSRVAASAEAGHARTEVSPACCRGSGRGSPTLLSRDRSPTAVTADTETPVA